jgi:hypothetical protein
MSILLIVLRLEPRCHTADRSAGPCSVGFHTERRREECGSRVAFAVEALAGRDKVEGSGWGLGAGRSNAGYRR